MVDVERDVDECEPDTPNISIITSSRRVVALHFHNASNTLSIRFKGMPWRALQFCCCGNIFYSCRKELKRTNIRRRSTNTMGRVRRHSIQAYTFEEEKRETAVGAGAICWAARRRQRRHCGTMVLCGNGCRVPG